MGDFHWIMINLIIFTCYLPRKAKEGLGFCCLFQTVPRSIVYLSLFVPTRLTHNALCTVHSYLQWNFLSRVPNRWIYVSFFTHTSALCGKNAPPGVLLLFDILLLTLLKTAFLESEFIKSSLCVTKIGFITLIMITQRCNLAPLKVF